MVPTACNYAAPGNALGIKINEPADCVYATGCNTCSWATPPTTPNPGTGTGTVTDGDTDNDGVCNSAEIAGCRTLGACNYNAAVTDPLPLTCDFLTCVGCMDSEACNYSATATQSNPASCTYPPIGFDDCAGTICTDVNNNSVCDFDESPVLGCIDSTACDYNSLANTADPLDACDYLLFSGFSSIQAASGDKVADGKVVAIVGGTGGTGTYLFRALGNDLETYVVDNKVFLTTNPFGPGGGLALSLTSIDATHFAYSTLLPGRYTFELYDSAGCEAVDTHSVIIPNRR